MFHLLRIFLAPLMQALLATAGAAGVGELSELPEVPPQPLIVAQSPQRASARPPEIFAGQRRPEVGRTWLCIFLARDRKTHLCVFYRAFTPGDAVPGPTGLTVRFYESGHDGNSAVEVRRKARRPEDRYRR
jgi:hypothetical protein